jgi:hypothetical protein
VIVADLPGRRYSKHGDSWATPVGRPGPASLQSRPANSHFEGYRDSNPRSVGVISNWQKGDILMRCQGYIVTVYDAECQPIEEYSAGNHPAIRNRLLAQGMNCLTSG